MIFSEHRTGKFFLAYILCCPLSRTEAGRWRRSQQLAQTRSFAHILVHDLDAHGFLEGGSASKPTRRGRARRIPLRLTPIICCAIVVRSYVGLDCIEQAARGSLPANTFFVVPAAAAAVDHALWASGPQNLLKSTCLSYRYQLRHHALASVLENGQNEQGSQHCAGQSKKAGPGDLLRGLTDPTTDQATTGTKTLVTAVPALLSRLRASCGMPLKRFTCTAGMYFPWLLLIAFIATIHVYFVVSSECPLTACLFRFFREIRWFSTCVLWSRRSPEHAHRSPTVVHFLWFAAPSSSVNPCLLSSCSSPAVAVAIALMFVVSTTADICSSLPCCLRIVGLSLLCFFFD